MSDPSVFRTGSMQRVDAGMITQDRLDALIAAADASETHLWVAAVAYYISDQAIEAMATEPIEMDTENMVMMPQIGCFLCEVAYEPRLRHRKCPGDAK